MSSCQRRQMSLSITIDAVAPILPFVLSKSSLIVQHRGGHIRICYVYSVAGKCLKST